MGFLLFLSGIAHAFIGLTTKDIVRLGHFITLGRVRGLALILNNYQILVSSPFGEIGGNFLKLIGALINWAVDLFYLHETHLNFWYFNYFRRLFLGYFEG